MAKRVRDEKFFKVRTPSDRTEVDFKRGEFRYNGPSTFLLTVVVANQ